MLCGKDMPTHNYWNFETLPVSLETSSLYSVQKGNKGKCLIWTIEKVLLAYAKRDVYFGNDNWFEDLGFFQNLEVIVSIKSLISMRKTSHLN